MKDLSLYNNDDATYWTMAAARNLGDAVQALGWAGSEHQRDQQEIEEIRHRLEEHVRQKRRHNADRQAAALRACAEYAGTRHK